MADKERPSSPAHTQGRIHSRKGTVQVTPSNSSLGGENRRIGERLGRQSGHGSGLMATGKKCGPTGKNSLKKARLEPREIVC